MNAMSLFIWLMLFLIMGYFSEVSEDDAARNLNVIQSFYKGEDIVCTTTDDVLEVLINNKTYKLITSSNKKEYFINIKNSTLIPLEACYVAKDQKEVKNGVQKN